MPRLIWVFAGRTVTFVGFVMRLLNYCFSLLCFNDVPVIKHRIFNFCASSWRKQVRLQIIWLFGPNVIIESPHNKTNNMTCVPSEDSDQPGHSPSLIRAFADRMKKPWVLSYQLSAQRRFWSGRVPRLILVSAGRTYNFVGFVIRRRNIGFTSTTCIITAFILVVFIRFVVHVSNMARLIGPRHEKTCLCHMRTTKAQISLRIRAVWSAPLLFAAYLVWHTLATVTISSS